jgi:phosphate transport system substrate-binding protein
MHPIISRLRTSTVSLTAVAVLGAALAVNAPAFVSAAGTQCPITIAEQGSTTVGPALVQAQSGFQTANGGCTLSITQNGSGAGLTAVAGGTADIAASSRPLKTSGAETGLYAWKIGGDAMVIAVKSTSVVSSITTAQVKGIWEGTITSWSTIDASASGTIVPRSRILGSGSSDDFLRLFGVGAAAEGTTISGTGLARLTTSADEADAACNNVGQVVYTSLANLALHGPSGSGCLKALTVDGVAPSVLTVQNGTYPAPRTLYLAMRKDSFSLSTAPADSALTKAKDLVNYMLSSAGQAAVGAVGFVQVAVPATKAILDYDVNTDGAVGLGDIGQITSKWSLAGQPSCPGWIRADVNNDGAIGLGDIGQITSKWGAAGFVAP